MTDNPITSARLKPLDIRYRFVRNLVAVGVIKIAHVALSEHPDVMAKVLGTSHLATGLWRLACCRRPLIKHGELPNRERLGRFMPQA